MGKAEGAENAAEAPEADVVGMSLDDLTAQPEAAPQPRIGGTCSNPDWTPTEYVPYQP